MAETELRTWVVTINGSWKVAVGASSAGEACTMAGDRWRAEFTGGEDRGAIFRVEARLGSSDGRDRV